MTRAALLSRPAALALCLAALFANSGCAHFRDAEERARERAENQPVRPPLADAALPPAYAPPPAPAPAPAPAPPAAAPAPMPEVAPPPPPILQHPKSKRRDHRAPPPAVSPPADNPVPVAVPEAPAAPPPPPPTEAPAPPEPAAASTAAVAPAPAPATADATIVFANNPGAACGSCDTLKISVTPSGQVLIESGHWAGNSRHWVYKRAIDRVGATRAAAFAASLADIRPVGEQLLASGPICPGPATEDDGLVIEWLEADRHDVLTVNFRCQARRDSPFLDKLRHAPDLLGLRQLVFPWGAGR